MLGTKRRLEGDCEFSLSKLQRLHPDDGERLRHSAASGNLVMLCQILDSNPDVINDPDYTTARTAIHEAALFSQPLIIDHLLLRNARVDLVDANGVTALHYAHLNRKHLGMRGKVGAMYRVGYPQNA